MKLFSRKSTLPQVETLSEDLSVVIETIEAKATVASRNQILQGESFEKGFSGKKISHATPVSVLGSVDTIDGKKYRDRSSNGQYRNLNDTLNVYSKKSVVNAIITLRANQVATYGLPARYTNDGIGYEVALKDRDREPTEEELDEIKAIEEFLHYTSTDRSTGINFRTWLKQTVRDTLTYDQANTELVYERDSRTKLKSFYAVDAGTVYYVVDKDNNLPSGRTEFKYVQKIGNEKGVFFKEGELTFDVMNPRTDLSAFRYGLPPLEVVLNQVAYHMTTESFNDKYFSQGGTTSGLLLINPGETASQQAMEDFRRDWQNRFQGENGAFKTPVVSAQDAKFVAMNASQKDMAFEQWVSYLINIISSNFGVDPAEIGFPNKGGAAGNKSNSLQEASKSELAQLSKDKGLSPLLDFISDVVNDNVVSRFGEGKYQFRFRGNEIAREIQLLNKYALEVTNVSPLNEVRAEMGKDPIDGGDALLNQHFINRIGQIQAQANADRTFEYQKKQDMKAEKLAKQQANVSPDAPADDAPGDAVDVMQNGQPKESQSSKQRNKD